MDKNKEKKYTYQEVCNMLCEACRLRIPMNTHVFNDRSYAIQHKVNGKDFSCQAADWRKVVKRKPHSRRETDDDYTLM